MCRVWLNDMGVSPKTSTYMSICLEKALWITLKMTQNFGCRKHFMCFKINFITL